LTAPGPLPYRAVIDASAAGVEPEARPPAARHKAEETNPTSIKHHALAANLPGRNNQPIQIRIATTEEIQQRSTGSAALAGPDSGASISPPRRHDGVAGVSASLPPL
jgi:hypothetical protein